MAKLDLYSGCAVADYNSGGNEIDWPPFSFKDGDTVYVNGEPFTYRRRGDEPATFERQHKER